MGQQGARQRTLNMISRAFVVLTTLLFTFGTLSTSFAFPNGPELLKRQEVESASSRTGGGFGAVNPPPPPGPPRFTGTKLVHDRAHPWRPLRNGDERGPCPGMNTLASHGVSSKSKLVLFPRPLNISHFSSTCLAMVSLAHPKLLTFPSTFPPGRNGCMRKISAIPSLLVGLGGLWKS